MLDRPAELARRPGVDHGADLSRMLDYLDSLQEHYGDDRDLNDRIRDAAVRLQSLLLALSGATEVEPEHGPDSGDPSAPSASGPVPRPPDGRFEAAFLRWLADPVGAEEVLLDEADRSPTPLRQVLDAVSSSVRPLPGDLAATLGMPAGTTIGHAVTELRLAVDDPDGPRCRSYRSAAYYLRGLDRIALATAEFDRAWR